MIKRLLSSGILLSIFCLTTPAYDFVSTPENFRIVTNPPPNPDFSGVAPLAVLFEAPGAAVSSADSGAVRPFHDFLYEWDFGDPNSGTWGTTGKHKHTDNGPIATHIYESSGIYTVTVTKRDHSGVLDTDTLYVEVTDPDTFFSGTKTTCISDTTNNDFSGCPSGAEQIATDDISSLISYTGEGRRVLFHRGSDWMVTQQIGISGGDTQHFGAYGSCTNPDALGICENAPLINTTTAGITIFNLQYTRDRRITDIEFNNASKNAYAFSAAIDFRGSLIYRVKAAGFNNIINLTHYRQDSEDLIENISIVSCDLSGSNNNVVYAGSENLIFMGNVIKNSDITHVVRLWQAYRGVISHNDISGANLLNANGRHALKLHGIQEDRLGTYTEAGADGLRNRTQFVVVSNNYFGTSGPWPVSIGPQNSLKDERVSDIIVEKNKSIADHGDSSSNTVQAALMAEGQYITIRNNIVDGSNNSASNFTGISVWRRGIEPPPTGIRIYNNTIYNPNLLSNYGVGVGVGSGSTDSHVYNNLISFPNATSTETAVSDSSGVAQYGNNVLTDTPYFTAPGNATPLSRDFSLTSSSTAAINQGTSLPVYDDFNGTYRTGVFDIGAFDY